MSETKIRNRRQATGDGKQETGDPGANGAPLLRPAYPVSRRLLPVACLLFFDLVPLVPMLVFMACATLADGEPGLDNPPSTRAGPFRLLRVGELAEDRVAPNAMDDQKRRLRDVSVLDLDGDPATLEVDAYFAASVEDADPEAPSTSIERLSAVDGRSFDRNLELVLEATEPWQGGRVGAPSVILGEQDGDEGREVHLYYEAEGGLGLALQRAGGGLEPRAEPVLTQADVPWASAPLRSPGAVRLAQDSYRLYFETARDGVPTIGVASSEDGLSWEDRGPVLSATGVEKAIDGVYVGSPHAVTAVGEEGREVVYVYYTGVASDGKQSIALAARFLDSTGEELDRSKSAMYGPPGSVLPREPCVVRFEEFTLLFATQRPAKNSPDVVVTVGVSPGDIELPGSLAAP